MCVRMLVIKKPRSLGVRIRPFLIEWSRPSFIPTIRSVAGSNRSRVLCYQNSRTRLPRWKREALFNWGGLYRRLGLTPNPEGTFVVYTILSRLPGLNRGPYLYERYALPTELRRQLVNPMRLLAVFQLSRRGESNSRLHSYHECVLPLNYPGF